MKERFLPLALAAAVFALGAAARGAQDRLAAARELYASAQYEEALKSLDALAVGRLAPATALAIHRHRALCLLALSRKAEAERAIEMVLEIDPFYQPGEDEAAPWIRAAFREVRQRVLPGALQQLYGRAKQSFDRKAWTEAAASFTSVLEVLDDKDLALDQEARADMRFVVQGFLDLAHAAEQMAAASPAPPQAAPSSPTPAPPVPGLVKPSGEPEQRPGKPSEADPAPQAVASAPADPTVVYDAGATDVVPPLPLRQSLPIADSLRPVGPSKQGSVEVVIGPDGSVEAATIRESMGSPYDGVVLQAVTAWRYRPAMKDGKPVRYRRLVRVLIPGREGDG